MNDEFSRALRPVKARLRRNRFLRGLAFGLLAGLAAALAVRILSLWIPLERKELWTLLPLPACALLGALAGALRPVRAKDAAEAADAAGLRERAVTALENADRDTEICRLQRVDACAALRSLDVKSIRPGSVKKVLLASLACAGALAVLLFVRVPADSAAEARSALRKTLSEGSEQVAQAAEKDGERLSREERAELRRLAEELDRDLSASRDEADALVALDRAQQRLEQLRAQTAGAAAAAAQGGASGAGDANQQGAGGAQAPGGSQNANGNSASGRGSMPNTASALSALKAAVNPSQAKASGQGANGNSGKSGQSGQSGRSGQSGQSGQSGNSGNSGNASGQAPQSSGQGPGQGGGNADGPGNQSGGGAGEGSTNLEQEGGGNGSGSHASGTRDPRYREEQYETIYDPERAEAARRDEITNQNRLGDEGSVQAETGPGKGSLGGDVPWGSVFGEYAETEARSAERENLTGQEREWVSEYFRLLTEQNEEQ